MNTDLPYAVVMDNCKTHHANVTKMMIQQNNITPIFLPPLSPFLNPIEYCFSDVKGVVKEKISNLEECDIQKLVDEKKVSKVEARLIKIYDFIHLGFNNVTISKCNNYCNHILEYIDKSRRFEDIYYYFCCLIDLKLSIVD